MEDRSSIHPYSSHQHLHRPSFQVTIPNDQSPELGYFSSQPPLDLLEHYGGRRVESSGSISTPDVFTGVSVESSADSGGYVSVSGNGLEGDASGGSHFDGDSGLKSHFGNSWYGGYNKEGSWDEGKSRESPVEDFYRAGERCGNRNDLHYFRGCASEDGQDDINAFATVKVEADYDGYDDFSCKVKDKSVHCREATISHYAKHRGSTCPFSGARSTDSYLGGEEEFGSSRSFGDDPSLQAELKPGSWLTPSPPGQAPEPGGDRWRGGADSQTSAVSAVCQPLTQKLDSFSEAFLSQRKRGFPLIGNRQMWRFWPGTGDSPGLITSSHASCVFDTLPDSHHPPSSSPTLPSLASPPPTSHHMPSVLSPPPTPLPPHLSLSPSKMDSFGGVGHSSLKGLDSLGMLQFFPPHVQSLPSVHPSGMMWNLPLQSHCLPQQTGDSKSIAEGHLRYSHFGEYGNPTANHNSPQTPEAPFVTSSSSPSSSRPSLDAPQNLSHLSGRCYEAGRRLTPYMETHSGQNGSLGQSHPKNATPESYTGTQFPSMLHSSRGFGKAHYVPRPILNPKRRGTGLYASLSSCHVKEEQTASSGEEGQGCELLPCINVGPDFQAELPPRVLKWEESRASSPDEESPREQLLWKPWEQGNNSQLQVESLLSMCSSSCLPGGGSNMELALHCLHYCEGDTMATLEMLLFSQPAPTEDYHYSGSDLWTDSEKDFFSTALLCYGKDFSLIQNTVRTKSVRQCVEFYFLHKKLLDKQRKRKEEEEKGGEGMELQARVAPFPQPMNNQLGLEGAVPAPLLASFFPCKLCGKMFYKIKSRNAHMKIHRQPQEDWSERRLQHQLLTQRLALMSQNFPPNPGSSGLLQAQASVSAYPTSALTSDNNNNSNNNSCTSHSVQSSHSKTTGNSVSHGNVAVGNDHAIVTYGAVNNPNAHILSSGDGSDSNRDTTPPVSFHQSWELVWKQP